MKDVDRRISQLRLCFLFTAMTAALAEIGFGQDAPAKAGEQNSTKNVEQNSSSETRLTLEAARREFEAQYARREEQAMEIVKQYREEAAQESPDPKKLTRLKTNLETVVTASLKNQLLLQKTRLRITELDLAELNSKYNRRESLSASIVARRVADLTSGEDLSWLTTAKKTAPDPFPETTGSQPNANEDAESAAEDLVPDFASPQELFDFLEKIRLETTTDRLKGVRILLKMLDKDELDRFAGAMMRTASMLSSASTFAKSFRALSPNGENEEMIRIGDELTEFLNESRLKNPPSAAVVAANQISSSPMSFFMLAFSQGPGESQTSTDAVSYSKKLRTAAKVLKNPRQFVIGFLKLMAEFPGSRDEPIMKPSDWQITIDGDKAVAVDQAMSTPQSSQLFSANRFELTKVGNTWKISSMISDEMILELQQGPTTSNSSKTEKPYASSITPSDDSEK